MRQSQYSLLKLETRFPVFQSLKGLVFYDGGWVRLKGRGGVLSQLGHSAGFGARYVFLKMFPAGLDWAFKLPPAEGAEFRLHFAMGFF